MKLDFKLTLLTLVLSLSMQQTSATNGYMPTGYGTISKGMAGAGIALPQESLSAATNPAGMVQLGHRADFGAALFFPDRGFTADPNASAAPQPSMPEGNYKSENDIFLIPHFGLNMMLDDQSSLSFLVGGSGGMNTEYDSAIWSNFNNPAGTASSPSGANLTQLFMGVNYSWKINDHQSFGIMPIFAIQRIKVTGLEPFRGFSTDPEHVTNNGYDESWGYGARIGWLDQLTDKLTLAASLQTRLYMTEFDQYSGLFAEQGDFDIPPNFTLGLNYKVLPEISINIDWQRIYYGDINALNNPNDTAINANNLLGADEGLGFGWKDIDIIKLGAQWKYDVNLSLRAGISHATPLFKNGNALFNVISPATPRTHISIGMSYQFSNSNVINLAYTHAYNEQIEGQNNNMTGPQTGFVEMQQDELEISYSWFFD